MPELPELRALSERLGVELSDRRLTSVAVPGFAGLKTVRPEPCDLVGARVLDVSSRGKFLSIAFDAVGRILVHLGNAGRVDLERPAKATRPRGALVRLCFDNLGVLVREHGTERRAGLWVLAPGDDGPLGALGPEPGEQGFEALVLRGADARHLHTMLRDQRTVAGIGRGYADDVLNRAGLSPFSSLSRLDDERRRALLASVRDVLAEALDAERRRVGGLSAASLGDRFAVHRRAGAPCPRCGRTLERVSYDAYEIVYCPACQTGGRRLADRRMSRLLR